MYAAEARSFAARQGTGAQDKATTHEIRSTRTRSHTHGHGRRRRLTQRAARAKTDGWAFGRSRARGHRRPVPRVVSPCCAVAPSRPRRPVPRARSPSAMHRLAARHRTRARPGASERESRAKRASPCTCPSRPGRYQPDACVDPAAFGYLWPPAAATADLARGLRCGRMEWRVSNFFIRGGG
jgi:hypothetical protein